MMRAPDALYHYTCHHGQAALRTHPVVLPAKVHTPAAFTQPAALSPIIQAMGSLAWFTDMADPDPWALGLTKNHLGCDRTRFRWRVTNTPRPPIRWGRVRATFPPGALNALELTDAGAQPARWWIATWPVLVTFDPIHPD